MIQTPAVTRPTIRTRNRKRTTVRQRAQRNREAWLTEVVRELQPRFRKTGVILPAVRVSTGWPGGKRGKNTIGQCWLASAAADGRAQIFISPVISDGRRAIDILAHELCHAAVGHEHGRPFALLATAIGLEGKPTETHAGPDLAEFASALVRKLGKYPHSALTDMTDGTKKQTTRMVRLTCACGTGEDEPAACGDPDHDSHATAEPRVIRMSRKQIAVGPILCGVCNHEFVAEEEPPAEDAPIEDA